MAKFSDISKDYAARIRTAVTRDRFTKSASASISNVRSSTVLSEFKTIASALNHDWKVDDEPLTEEQKKTILRGIAENLGLDDPTALFPVFKSASNDNHTDMVVDVVNIVNDILKK
ncbi:MAG TPA: hypothetical protein VMV69_10310 [Pirellulales bacterium]|nr:hypothetical protein [Pirellulales bacterium]